MSSRAFLAKNNASEKAGGYLAIAAVALYVSCEIIFRYSSLLMTYPMLSELGLWDFVESAVVAICIASLLLRSHNRSMQKALFFAFAFCVLFYSAWRTNDFRLAHGFIILITVSGIEYKRLFSTYYKTVLLMLVALICLSLAGFVSNNDVIPNSRLVFSYGFAHPNGLGALLYSAIGAMAFVHWSQKSWVLVFALALLAALFSYVVLSSHAAAVVLFLLAAAVVTGHRPKLHKMTSISKKAFCAILISVPTVLLCFMLYSMVLFDEANALQSWINGILHYRPYFAHSYYEQQGGFTLMGREYVNLGHYHNGLPFTGVDSGYCFIPLVYGLLTLAVIAVCYVIAIISLSRRSGRFPIFALLLIGVFYLLMETYPLYPIMCFSALFLSAAFDENATVTQSGKPDGETT